MECQFPHASFAQSPLTYWSRLLRHQHARICRGSRLQFPLGLLGGPPRLCGCRHTRRAGDYPMSDFRFWALVDTILHVCYNKTLIRTKNDHF